MNEVACLSPLTLTVALVRPDSLNPICSLLLFEPTHPPSMRWPRYIFYFVMTCVLEAPIYWSAYWAGARGRTAWERVRQIFILNIATHPAVTWLFPYAFFAMNRPYRDTIFWSESFAWVTEALILWRVYNYKAPRAILVSIVANVWSWWIGLYLAPWLLKLF